VNTNVRALVLVGMLVLVGVMWGLSFASKRMERIASGVAALPTRRFEGLTAVTAGTGGTYANQLRLGPCVVVGLGDELVLVDAGRATAEALRAADIPVEQPRTLLLTSLLPENVLGVDDWLWGVALAEGGARRVIGPPGTRALVEGLREAHRPGAKAEAASLGIEAEPGLEVIEAEDGFETGIGGLGIRAVAQRGGPLPALAWRFEAGGRSLAVSAIGVDAEALVNAARGADLWIHEALSGESLDAALAAHVEGAEGLAREAALHTRLEEVGALAARAGVGRLVLVRLRPPPVFASRYTGLVGKTYPGPVSVAEDGDEFRP
jgi:ribonuclease Z